MKFTKKILKNGVRVLLVPNKESVSINMLILVEAGSKYESKQQGGISHFLEHLCFKGTTKRPTPLDLARELDALGAQYNAFTSHEYTGYYITCLPNKTDHALDILADMYKNPLFDQKELEKERGVIFEEINMIEDQPQSQVGYLLMELLYGDCPAGRSILGTKETLSKMNREDFINYRKQNYLASATTVVVSGKFEQGKILKKLNEYLGDLPTGKKNKKEKVIEKQTAPALVLRFKESEQTHLAMAFRTFGLEHKDIYVAALLAGVLGGGMSSRLFQRVRHELGAAYYVRASHDPFTDHGFLEVDAGVDNARFNDVVSAILDECRRLSKELVSDEELQKTKDNILGNMFLGMETSAGCSSFYGFQELLEKKILTPEEVSSKIKAVTPKDILRLAKSVFKNDKLNLALIGPHKNKSSIAPTLRV